MCVKTITSSLRGESNRRRRGQSVGVLNFILMRLINFMDLYRTYLAAAMSDEANHPLWTIVSEPGPTVLDAQLGLTPLVSFEQFIGDSRLLALAAAVATTESGERVVVPAPLHLSANANLDGLQ